MFKLHYCFQSNVSSCDNTHTMNISFVTFTYFSFLHGCPEPYKYLHSCTNLGILSKAHQGFQNLDFLSCHVRLPL